VATYLRRVAQGASRIASGDLEYRLASDPLRESRAVAEAFNRMAESLKQLLEARSEERNRLAAVLSTMTDGVILVDREGVIQLVNPAVGSLLELASPPQEGERLISVVRDHEVQQLARLSLERHQVQQAQVEQPRTRRLLHVTAVPLSSAGGDGALLLLHDLTPARRLEVTRREFISNVSHELRTPLASVQAAVETLEDRALGDPVAARDFLRRIRSDVERMTRIVSDLLELSRLESGKSAVSLAPTDMVALLGEVVERFAPRAAAQGLELRLEIPRSLPWVQADRYRLQGAVANLLDNAVKFTPAAGSVTVSARHQGDWLQVQVRDTGIGIAPEHLPHVFERFYMVDRSSRQPGVGLGLSIAKHVVQAHGGTIQVESQEGAGSVFTLTIPVGAARS
jgi:two-component system phosphate regulon sensor histidine kinase PhoR